MLAKAFENQTQSTHFPLSSRSLPPSPHWAVTPLWTTDKIVALKFRLDQYEQPRQRQQQQAWLGALLMQWWVTGGLLLVQGCLSLRSFNLEKEFLDLSHFLLRMIRYRFKP